MPRTIPDRAWAILVARAILGIVFFVAGVYKTFMWGPLEHARLLFVEPYAKTFLPVWALWASGAAIPVIELIAGFLVLVGLWTRPSLIVLGAILVFVSFGHLLVQPGTSINSFILPRSALLLIVLLTPAGADRLSLDGVRADPGTGRAEAAGEGAARFERAWAIFVLRTILGFVYFFAGVHKLADPGAIAFGRQMMASDGARVVGSSLAMAAGALTPFLEIAIGTLLLAGLWMRATLRVVVLLVIGIAVAYGIHGLRNPIGATAMNVAIVNFYILPRAALVMVLLFLDRDDDALSIDGVLNRRAL